MHRPDVVSVVAIPIICAIIGVAFKKSGRKQKVGDIHGDGNNIINGNVVSKMKEYIATIEPEGNAASDNE